MAYGSLTLSLNGQSVLFTQGPPKNLSASCPPKAIICLLIPWCTTNVAGNRSKRPCTYAALCSVIFHFVQQLGTVCFFLQVCIYDLTRYEHCPDDVLVLGTDGLWDVTSDQEVANVVFDVLMRYEPNDLCR